MSFNLLIRYDEYLYWGSRSSGSWYNHLGLILLLLLCSHLVAQLCLTLCNPMDCRCQVSLFLSLSQRLLKLMFIESMMPSNYLILCHPLLLLPSVFPSIRDFSSELVLQIRWPKYWSFSFSVSPSNEYSGMISFRIDWFDLAVQRTLKSHLHHHSLSTLWRSTFLMVQLSRPNMTTGKIITLTWRFLSAKWCLCFLICCLDLS